jgi:type II secretory pathway component PulK
MKIRTSTGNQGIALIIALISIFILAGLAAEFALSMKVETKLASNANNDDQLVWLGRSGVEYARWVLAQQAAVSAEPYDSLNQKWAGGTGTMAESNSPLASISLDNIPVGDGSFSVKIIDGERKLNINAADDPLIKQVLTQMGVDASQQSVISDSILDWINPGDMPRMAGAKSDYYQTQTPPYYSKDAPIDDLSELLLIRGISDHTEIYWGGADPNGTGMTFHHQLGMSHSPNEIASYPFGLTNVFTAISSGKLNINTADANTLQCLPGMDQTSAEELIKMRSGPDGVDGNDDDVPFRSTGQIGQIGINTAVVGQISRYLTVRSTTFEVEVTAQTGPSTKHYHAILLRASPNDIRVVGFYCEE